MPARRARHKPSEVFLSHAHQDLPYLKKLAKDLRRHGVRVWFSTHNLEGADQWIDEIGVALDRCDWLIVILTPAAVRSGWVKTEVNFALKEKRYRGRVIPLVLKRCNPKKLAWPLTTIQYVDALPYQQGLRALLAIWGIRFLGR
jgi:hypothetical protein